MSRWARPTWTLGTWLVAVVVVGQLGTALGAYGALPWALAVAVTGAALGAWAGVLAGATAGTLVAFGIDPRAAAPVAWASAVADGALLLPVVLMGLGGAAAAGARLRAQLRLHRRASVRAQYDVLTGALNRRSFERRLEAWIADPAGAGSGFAVLFIDLDRFKFVNDTFGHAVGDELLLAITGVLQANVREADLVSRFGGDEFVIALAGVRDPDAAAAVAGKLVQQLGAPFQVDGKLLSVSASVGVALYPHDGGDVQAIVRSADAAMYAVKAAGKNSFNFSSLEQRHRQVRRREIEQQLRCALREDEFALVYQPQLELGSGRLVGFEALLRWRNDLLGEVAPAEFVPIAEEAGMIVPIGRWLMREACRQAQAWTSLAPGLRMAINVTSLQLRQPDFLAQVGEAIRDAGIDPGRIELELTEGVLVEQPDLAVSILIELDALGVRSTVDDFGTGYSSLAYLQRLPVRSLKIDRSLVRGLDMAPSGVVGDALPVVEAIVAMGLKLGKTMVAEGVETDAQARYLQRIGVAVAQGYLYAMPLSVDQAEALLRRLAAVAPPAALPRGSRVEERRDLRPGRNAPSE